jgi:serine/threonine protein kinase
MNYKIKKVNFEISNFTTMTKNIINTNLLIHYDNSYITYKISNYIGKGSVGQVYLLESNNDSIKYIIKISNNGCKNEIIDEINFIEHYFTKHNINHISYPLYFGTFKNLNAVGVIYPYFGFYNLEKIKTIIYNIDFTNNIKIIIQLINQLKSLTNIIHADLKPVNVVIDIDINTLNIMTTIIDFGLIKDNESTDVISTNFVTSPESLLTLDKFKDCVDTHDPINLLKHDYFGLFSIIINLFIKSSFWQILYKYLLDLKFNSEYALSQSAAKLYVYIWYKFNYTSKDQIKNKSLLNLINKLEIMYPSIINKKFLCYDTFFNNYIKTAINYSAISKNNLNDLKNFARLLVNFDFTERPSYDELLKHAFITNHQIVES